MMMMIDALVLLEAMHRQERGSRGREQWEGHDRGEGGRWDDGGQAQHHGWCVVLQLMQIDNLRG